MDALMLVLHARDRCIQSLSIDWNLQIKSIINLGSIHITGVSALSSVRAPPNNVIVSFNINGTGSPQADISLSATGFSTYNGLVNLGDITFKMRILIAFNCSTKQIESISIQPSGIMVEGVNVTFQSSVANIFVLIRNVFNNKVQSALEGPLQTFSMIQLRRPYQ